MDIPLGDHGTLEMALCQFPAKSSLIRDESGL